MNQAKIISQSTLIIEEVNDPEADASMRASLERHRRNSEWLQAHWADVLPQARGKFLAVANQEPFLADTPEEAWNWVRITHPEDYGTAVIRYIRKDLGPRIYAHQSRMAAFR